MLRWAPALTLALFLAPVLAGLVGTLLPAFGHLPALGRSGLSLEPWRELVALPGLATSVRLSLTTGFAATAIALALVLGFTAAWHDSVWLARLRRALAPLLAMPHVAAAFGLAFVVAPSGWLARLVSPWATGWDVPPDLLIVQDPAGFSLVAALVIKESAFLMLMVLAALGQIDAERRMAVARSLGYGPVTGWLKTVLPGLYARIRLPVYAVLAFSLSVVDMAVILAPNAPAPLAVEVMRLFGDPDLAKRFAGAAGALLQLGLAVAAIALWRLAEIAIAALARPWLAGGARGGRGTATRALSGLAMGSLLAAAAGGVIAAALWSFARSWRFPDPLPGSWSLATWTRQLDGLADPFWITLSVAAAAALIALLATLACLENESRRRRAMTERALWLVYLPLLVPQIGFLFGVQLLLIHFDMDGSWGAVLWSHLLFVLPYVFLALGDHFRALDPRFAQTAAGLGAGPARVFWRVKLPLLLRPVLIACAVGFAVSVAQYLPTLFAGAGRIASLTTEAVSLASGGDRRVLGIYALAQTLLPWLAFTAAVAIPAWRYRHRRALQVAQ